MKKFLRFCVSSVLLCIPGVIHASVSFSEIAWMGGPASANHEWIELYNDGDTPIDLSNWSIQAVDGSPSVALSGTIAAGSYYLLERTSDATEPSAVADQIYTGALSNEGEDLSLTDGGVVVDTAGTVGGWEAGVRLPILTMARIAGVWASAVPTPRSANPTNASDVNTSDTTTSPTDTETEDVPPKTTSGGSGGSSTVAKQSKVVTPKVIFTMPSAGVAQAPQSFEVTFTKGKENAIAYGRYIVNMGDGSVYTFDKRTTFDHTYEFEGEYTISVSYWTRGMSPTTAPLARIEKVFRVISVPFTLESHTRGVIIKNTSKDAVDISRWVLTNGSQSFVVPKDTIIKGRSTLGFSNKVTGVYGENITLVNASGETLAKTEQSTNNKVISKIVHESPVESVASSSVVEVSDTALVRDDLSADAHKKSDTTKYVPLLLVAGLLLLGGGVLLFGQKEKKEDSYTVTIVEE